MAAMLETIKNCRWQIMINYRQLVIDQLKFKETKPVPYARLYFEEGIAKKMDQYLASDKWRSSLHNAIIGWSGICVGSNDQNVFTDEYGITWTTGKGAMHIESPPLNQPSLRGYDFPDVNRLCPDELLSEINRNVVANKNFFTNVGFGFGLFERTWTLRGFENTLMDVAAEPRFYMDMLSCVAEHQLKILSRLLQTDVDSIYFSDDWGDQRGVIIGAERWRHLIKPHLAVMYGKVHKAGKFVMSHCCGNISEIIRDCIDIGLDCLQSVQPEAMNPYDLKKRFGGQISFWGGLGSQTTIPFGTCYQIKAEIHKLCVEMGRGGGYILGTAKSILNDTPVENAVAVMEAFNNEFESGLENNSVSWG